MTDQQDRHLPSQVRRRDGGLVPFDIRRIESAVERAARETGRTDGKLAAAMARAVADDLCTQPRRAPSVEEIQDAIERQLMATGFDDVARAYLVYRQQRAELRDAKALLGIRDDLKLSLAAVTVLRERYLLRDGRGSPAESTAGMMDRVAQHVAAAEDLYEPGSSTRWAEEFSTMLRARDFLPNSPTLMNADTRVGLLSGCFVLPVEDSLVSIFSALGQAALIHQAGGGTGYTFSHLLPPATASPARKAPRAARCHSSRYSTPRPKCSANAAGAARPAWPSSTSPTPTSTSSSRPNAPAASTTSTSPSAFGTRLCMRWNEAGRIDWSSHAPTAPHAAWMPPSCCGASARTPTNAATQDCCSSIPSTGPTPSRSRVASKPPTLRGGAAAAVRVVQPWLDQSRPPRRRPRRGLGPARSNRGKGGALPRRRDRREPLSLPRA